MFSSSFKLGMVRVAGRGVVAVAVVLAAAGISLAGGSGHSMGSMGSGNSSRQFSGFNQSNGGNNNSNKLDLHKISGNSQSNNSSNKLGDKIKINKTDDSIKNVKNNDKPIVSNKLDLNKIGKLSGNKDSLKNDKPNNLFSNKLKMKDSKDFKDFCKDKCVHDCFKCCPWWYCWNYPHWCSLYGYGCGCWYDVPVVQVEGVDLQLLAVRMIDAGDEDQGPAYRVWVRNNSHVTIEHGFNVLLLAAHDATPAADLPQSGVRIPGIEAGQVLPIDIRLPATANQPGLPMLHVLVDSHREIAEVFEDNNGAVLNRGDILPVDAQEAAPAAPVAVAE